MLFNLEKYMFTNENIIRLTRDLNLQQDISISHNKKNTQELNKKYENKSREQSQNNNKSHDNRIYPDGDDKLFWCFYISLNGIDKYLLEKNAQFKIEKDFKINSVSKLREIKTQLKAIKLKLSEIEDDLVNKRNISINTLNALALYYKLSFIVLLDDIYYDFNYNCGGIGDEASYNYFVIESVENKKWFLKQNVNKDEIKKIKETYYLVDSSKPIKSISSYTLNELQDIAHKLKLNIKQENGKNKLKKDLYENIIQKLGKLM
jgi:hypothetical protein